MFLQLHGHNQMASNRYPEIPDLQLPQVYKIPNRQILVQGIEEGTEIASKYLQNYVGKQKADKDENKLSEESLKKLEEILPALKTVGLSNKHSQMSGITWAIVGKALIKGAKFIFQFGKQIYNGVLKAAKTINLVRLNQEIESLYQSNQFNSQNLNEMSKREIDAQLENMSVELLNAQTSKNERRATAIGRLMQVYNVRRVSVPVISRRQIVTYGGAALILLLLLRRK
tara:strand:- start:2645 stop:3328 length:684 start_codon:yes stop_codon:yes gene_type:complete